MIQHDESSNQLIPLTEQDGIQAVTGRDLHAFLDVDTEYRHWMPRMISYGFEEGKDYAVKNDRVRDSLGREREAIGHVISLDMAKEISMIQRTEKGKQARQYFIECEKRAKAAPALTGPELMAKALLEADTTIKSLERQAALAAPKVAYHDKFVAVDDDVMTIGDWGAHYGLTQPQAFERLNGAGLIYRKAVTREFSGRRGQVVDRNEWRAYAAFRNLFDLRAQHNAPRYHNGQVRQTLYVKASWAFSLARQVGLEDLNGTELTPFP